MPSNKNISAQFLLDRKESDKFLGTEIIEKYPRLYPFLRYLLYRLYYFDDLNRQTPEYPIRTYEGYLNPREPLIKNFARIVLRSLDYCIYHFIPVKRRKGSYVLLSKTLVFLDRYKYILPEFSRHGNMTSLFCASHILSICPKKDVTWRNYISSFSHFKNNNIRPIFFGDSPMGQGFYCIIDRLYDILLNIYNKNESCETYHEILFPLLDKLDFSMKKTLKKMKKVISKENISQYITINQYYISEIAVIMACKELGITTKQLAHSPSQIATFSKRTELFYTDDGCLWDNADVEFHINNLLHDSGFNSPSIKIYAVGNMEITYSQAVEYTKKYPMQRIISFITSMAEYEDDKMMEVELAWRKSVFEQMSVLAKRQNLIPRIRYRPACSYEITRHIREREKPLLEKLGFIISPSDTASLMSDIVTSMAIISTQCSVIYTANILGRQVYRLDPPHYDDLYGKYIKTNYNLIDLEVCDIGNLIFPDDYKPHPILREDFLDIDKLLSKKKVDYKIVKTI